VDYHFILFSVQFLYLELFEQFCKNVCLSRSFGCNALSRSNTPTVAESKTKLADEDSKSVVL